MARLIAEERPSAKLTRRSSQDAVPAGLVVSDLLCCGHLAEVWLTDACRLIRAPAGFVACLGLASTRCVNAFCLRRCLRRLPVHADRRAAAAVTHDVGLQPHVVFERTMRRDAQLF